MYHTRLKGSHYEAGYHWGQQLYQNHQLIKNNHTFLINEERRKFAKQCLPIYQKYYPEILEEIKGIAEGQKMSYEELYTFLLSMYCFDFCPHCTCIAIKEEEQIVFGRNSDFFVELEKLYMNCIYQLNDAYAFQGNTTAFVEMEDGANEYALAVGLTSVCPINIKPGFNAGMIVRYLLEKCSTTRQVIEVLKKIPIASSQTLMIADQYGDIVVIECNCNEIKVIEMEEHFLVTTNHFHSNEMLKYNREDIDDWKSKERYQVAYSTLKNKSLSFELVKDILKGQYGFMCQYDRRKNADTVWSVIYDLKHKDIYRVEGNPRRKDYKRDKRFSFR